MVGLIRQRRMRRGVRGINANLANSADNANNRGEYARQRNRYWQCRRCWHWPMADSLYHFA
jgi:hypothetical protein